MGVSSLKLKTLNQKPFHPFGIILKYRDTESQMKMYKRELKTDLFYSTRQFLCLCVVALIILSGCHSANNSAEKCVATVDGEKISLSDFNKRFKRELDIMDSILSLKENEIERLKEEILNKLIDEKIMRLRAEKLSLSVSDDELMKRIEEITRGGFDKIFPESKVDYNTWKEKLRKRVILEKLINHDVKSVVRVSEDEALAYYKNHPEKYISGERVHVAQIVVQNRKKAEDILKRLKNGENFGKVAQKVSTGPESAREGDLGIFGRGIMPESFDKIVFSLPPGKISNVIKTPYGYHIFKILKKDDGKEMSFVEVKNKIISELRREKEEHKYVKWLERLRSEVDIKINKDLLKKVEVS